MKMMWNKTNYCEIDTIEAPKNMFWTPDIGIMERYKNKKYLSNLLIHC